MDQLTCGFHSETQLSFCCFFQCSLELTANISQCCCLMIKFLSCICKLLKILELINIVFFSMQFLMDHHICFWCVVSILWLQNYWWFEKCRLFLGGGGLFANAVLNWPHTVVCVKCCILSWLSRICKLRITLFSSFFQCTFEWTKNCILFLLLLNFILSSSKMFEMCRNTFFY